MTNIQNFIKNAEAVWAIRVLRAYARQYMPFVMPFLSGLTALIGIISGNVFFAVGLTAFFALNLFLVIRIKEKRIKISLFEGIFYIVSILVFLIGCAHAIKANVFFLLFEIAEVGAVALLGFLWLRKKIRTNGFENLDKPVIFSWRLFAAASIVAVVAVVLAEYFSWTHSDQVWKFFMTIFFFILSIMFALGCVFEFMCAYCMIKLQKHQS